MSKYRVIRDGVIIAETDVATYTDSSAAVGTVYTYRVENWDGVVGGAAEVSAEKPMPKVHKFVANREITWPQLPTADADNGSLTLVGQEVRENVPAWVDTRSGELVSDMSVEDDGDGLPEYYEVQHGTRAVYTYEADFGWGGSINNLNYLVDVLEFKGNQLASGYYAFYFCPAETITALPDLDTSNLTSMERMFAFCSSFNQPLDTFDTCNVTKFSQMLAADAFNQPVNFNTSAATHLDQLFSGARAFNSPVNFVGGTEKVENAVGMFSSCNLFNQPLDTLGTLSNVTNFGSMFNGAAAFNQDLSHFDTSNATDMQRMFENTKVFNQDLSHFNTSKVTNMSYAFWAAEAFNQDISGWCVSQIASKPTNFDVRSGFEGQTAKQPKWGQAC